jgi:protease II
MLYGYGGFSISTTPTYRPDVPAFLELGGVWVTASMRGGAEYGESWHRAGMLEKKQNVFDDFIAVAEYLVKEKYTSPSKLAISGGSNGGLLVGAVEEQRPDLFAVAPPSVSWTCCATTDSPEDAHGRLSTVRRPMRSSSRSCTSTHPFRTSSREPAIRRRS